MRLQFGAGPATGPLASTFQDILLRRAAVALAAESECNPLVVVLTRKHHGMPERADDVLSDLEMPLPALRRPPPLPTFRLIPRSSPGAGGAQITLLSRRPSMRRRLTAERGGRRQLFITGG